MKFTEANEKQKKQKKGNDTYDTTLFFIKHSFPCQQYQENINRKQVKIQLSNCYYSTKNHHKGISE